MAASAADGSPLATASSIANLRQSESGMIVIGQAEEIRMNSVRLPHRFGARSAGSRLILPATIAAAKPDREPVTVGACIEHVSPFREAFRDPVDVCQEATDGDRRRPCERRHGRRDSAVSDERMTNM